MAKIPLRPCVPIEKCLFHPMKVRVKKGEEQYPILFFPCSQDQWRIYYMDLREGAFYKKWEVTEGLVFINYGAGMAFLKEEGWLPL